MMGWERSFLQSAVDTCTNPSGQIEDCALFDIQSSADFSSCKIKLPDAIAKEAISTKYVSPSSGPSYLPPLSPSSLSHHLGKTPANPTIASPLSQAIR